MFANSENPTMQEALVQALLAALTTVPGGALLTTPKVHLYTAVSQAITPTIPVSAFTEAAFTGYASQALTITGPVNTPVDGGQAWLGNVQFKATSAPTPPGITVLGYWVDNGSTTVYLAEAFATPVLFVLSGDYLDLGVLFGLPFVTNVA